MLPPATWNGAAFLEEADCIRVGVRTNWALNWAMSWSLSNGRRFWWQLLHVGPPPPPDTEGLEKKFIEAEFLAKRLGLTGTESSG
jgi:hypothetical protein